MAKVELLWAADPDGITFRLIRRRLIGGETVIPPTDWTVAAGEGLINGTGQLLAWSEEERAERTDDGVRVPHALIASSSAGTCRGLGLPPAAPFVLDLQHVGTMDRPEFRFRVTWLQPTLQPLPAPRRQGAILHVGNRSYLVPDPLFSVIEAAEAFNRAPPGDADERYRQWARMRSILPEETENSIRVGGYLKSTRIAHAVSFSLSLHSGADGFNFAPVLFGQDVRADVDAGDRVHETQNLLPPVQHRTFSQRRFREFPECRARYTLGDGWYVVIDEPLRRALSVVRKAQQADRETRRRFAQNPRAYLGTALAEEFGSDELEGLFVETAEYSARVQDVGLWQPKTLPWVARSKESWLPERFGIRIGNRIAEFRPEDLPVLEAALKEAIGRGEPTISWDGQEVPATPDTLAAITALSNEIKPPPQSDATETGSTAEDDTSEEGEVDGPIVLQIEENFDTVGFERALAPRRAAQTEPSPVCLETSLKPHQREGLSWLQAAWRSGLPGVLLADDMGLGKTLQALSFLAWLREGMVRGGPKRAPILIVAPTGLLKNWEQEHNRHLAAPGLGNLLRAHGPELKALRNEPGAEIAVGRATLDAERIAKADWVMTTYETMRDYQHSFGGIRFAVVVFDEVQKIKTPGTVMTHAAKALNADFIIGLTGTPIENRLADLWCIVDTVCPGILGDLASFSRKYEKDERPEDLRQLKALLTEPQAGNPPLMLRRMKLDRLEGLPEKHEHVIAATMPGKQAQAYSEVVMRARTGKGTGSRILEVLHQLRGISLHPLHPELVADESYVDLSARLQETFKILDRIASKGEKALIFLESLEMQPYLAALIQRRYKLPNLPMLINGSVSGPIRQKRVNEFQSGGRGFDVIILSPRAGGVGITLTAANHVIHLSRWWNPAVEDQCTDRAYRIGQSRPVHVYYPQAIHPEYREQSFDRRLHSLLENKRQLSREMLMPPMSPHKDSKRLFEETVTGDADSHEPAVDLDEIDAMEPWQFEAWVLERLRRHGYRVHKTPRSHDAGADGIAYGPDGELAVIVQCKHCQGPAPCSDAAVRDLIRAKDAYALDNALLAAVTNARDFSQAARRLAAANSVKLVSRTELANWPSSVTDPA